MVGLPDTWPGYKNAFLDSRYCFIFSFFYTLLSKRTIFMITSHLTSLTLNPTLILSLYAHFVSLLTPTSSATPASSLHSSSSQPCSSLYQAPFALRSISQDGMSKSSTTRNTSRGIPWPSNPPSIPTTKANMVRSLRPPSSS